MTTAEIIFTSLAVVCLLISLWIFIKARMEKFIPFAAWMYSGICLMKLANGDDPVETCFRWVFWFAFWGFIIWLNGGNLESTKLAGEQADPPLGKQPSVYEMFMKNIRNK